jgi:phosphatidylglycerophosphate synthase
LDGLLGALATQRYRPSAWAGFWGQSLARSADQARKRPAAAAEVTLLHLLTSVAGSPMWAFASWFLCITHLGLLGERSTLGWPNRLTVVRALLPAVASNSRWTSLLALATDFADGCLARRGHPSAFGAFADPIADGVFWSWYALRWERRPWLRWAPVTLFGAATTAIAFAYFALGRTIDYPRPQAFRYASAAAQIVLAFRSLSNSAVP